MSELTEGVVWPPESRAPWSGGPSTGDGSAGRESGTPQRPSDGRWGPLMPGDPPLNDCGRPDPSCGDRGSRVSLASYVMIASRSLA
ncbi:hypothetical protein NDU88_003805 [Pleurodeles waltl]|uniref:Uncharacterized protein n=1 Tax=Pleurodeles waltl TaxID=8319 RepID=A0AAV7V114_PLEWA|nr:hypothetical protein NDU88_003805 [Pleurodeles waltl]